MSLGASPEPGRVMAAINVTPMADISAVWKVLELCREAGADEIALLSQKKVGG